MSQNYSLWIVSPPGLIWSRVFDEVALGLQSAFAELHYEVAIVTDPKDITGTAVVLGAHLAKPYGIALPKDCIIFNLEQVHATSTRFSPEDGYIDALKTHSVWDYSHTNIATLTEMGVENVTYCGIGYAPELTRIRRVKEDIDVLFVGGGDPRREPVLHEIGSRGIKFHQVFKMFGQERDDFIARGKIHLNLHKESAKIFEVVRVSYLLSNRCFVISETGMDKELEAAYAGGVVFCEYDQLVERCLRYLLKPRERRFVAEAGFELMRKMPQRTFLAAALDAQNKINHKHALDLTRQDKPQIFVAIGSFRDPECQQTLMNLFLQAAHPGRVSVGICLQFDAELEKNAISIFPPIATAYAQSIITGRKVWAPIGRACRRLR